MESCCQGAIGYRVIGWMIRLFLSFPEKAKRGIQFNACSIGISLEDSMSTVFEYQNLILFLLGLVFLAFGRWVIRYGGESLLFFLGAAGGFFLYNFLLTKAFIPHHNLYLEGAFILVLGLFLGCLARYNGVVGRKAELFFLAGLIFLFREKISQTIGISEWIFTVTGVFLVIFSFPLALAFLATILFFLSGVTDIFPYGRIIVPALTVAYVRIRYGSFFCRPLQE